MKKSTVLRILRRAKVKMGKMQRRKSRTKTTKRSSLSYLNSRR